MRINGRFNVNYQCVIGRTELLIYSVGDSNTYFDRNIIESKHSINSTSDFITYKPHILNIIKNITIGFMSFWTYGNQDNREVSLILNGNIHHTIQLYRFKDTIENIIKILLRKVVHIEYLETIHDLLISGLNANVDLALTLKFAWL